MSIHERRRPAARTRHHAGRSTVAALAAVLALGAMPAGGSASVDTGSPTPDGALLALPLNTQLWPGTSAIVLQLWHGDGTGLDPRLIDATVRATGPDGTAGAATPLVARQLIPGGPWFATTDLPLDAVGTWTLDLEAVSADETLRGSAALTVAPDSGVLPLGAAIPDIRTPTLASSGYHLPRITTDAEPEPSFYWTSVSEALAAHRPFVLAIDSIGIRTSSACGGAVDHLRHLQKEFPGLLLIHAEPWVTREQDGRLWPDPIDGPPRPAPWTAALGITSAPWILVVDAEGRLRAKLTDVFGSDELRAAVREIAPWAPGGH